MALPAGVRETVAPLLTLLDTVNEAIATAEAALARRVTQDADMQRLTTAPPIGPVTAAAFVATVDRVGRFTDGSQVGSYVGLVPSEASSADYRRRGPITKRGNSRLRWLLVQAAWGIWRSPVPEAQPLPA